MTTLNDALNGLARNARGSRVARWIAIGVTVVTVLGFLVAPPIAKWQITKAASETLGREVHIGKLAINPFALSVRVRDFRLLQASGGETAFGFDELYVNLSAVSLFRLAPVLDEIRLVRPVVRIVRDAGKRYNFQDIVDRLSEKPGGKPTEPGPPPRFSLNNIEIVDGQVDFDDRPAGRQHRVSAIQVGIPFISNLPHATDITVEPAFSAQVNGSPIELKGATKPFKDTRETSFRIVLDALDLARYADYAPVPLGFRVAGGALSTNITLSLTTRANAIETLTIAGTAGLKGLSLTNEQGAPLAGFDTLETSAAFELARRDGKRSMTVRNAATSLRGLRVSDGASQDPLAAITEISVHDTTADLIAHSLVIGTLAIREPRARIVRERDGSFNFDSLAGRKQEPASSGPAAESEPKPEPAEPAEAQSPWVVTVAKVEIMDGAADFTDKTPATTFHGAITDLDVEVDHLSTARDASAAVKVSVAFQKRGVIHAEGGVVIDPPRAELDMNIKDIGLANVQPYVAEQLNIVITQGTFGTRGKLEVAAPVDAPLRARYRGDINVNGLATVDSTTEQDLLRWKRLELKGVDFVLDPLKAHVREIALRDFYSRLIINADGTLNLQQLAREQPPAKGAGATVAADASPSAKAPASGERPADLRIGRIVLAGGNVNFSDYFVKPNFTANLTGVGGTVTEITTESAGDVALQAAIDETAPVEVKGRVNPLGTDLFVDLAASARDIELPPLSPYSVKYAGYGIEKGKLSVRLNYFIEDRKLKAENGVYLDQLTFGEKIESPTATKLPVLLAVSLLKNRNGVIDVNLPISGSLDDPEFRIGRIILDVLGNLIAKAATAPFALLGAAFGGGDGEELGFVDFNAGNTVLAATAEQKLGTLAKALVDRPGLSMEIAGRTDPATDPDAYRRALVAGKIKAQKLKALARNDAAPQSVEELTIAPEEYERYLSAAYKAEKFSKPRNFIGITKDLPASEMERLMFENMVVSNEDLRTLANRRAQAVKDWLVAKGQVPAERLYIVAPLSGDAGLKEGQRAGPRAEFTLK